MKQPLRRSARTSRPAMRRQSTHASKYALPTFFISLTLSAQQRAVNRSKRLASCRRLSCARGARGVRHRLASRSATDLARLLAFFAGDTEVAPATTAARTRVFDGLATGAASTASPLTGLAGAFGRCSRFYRPRLEFESGGAVRFSDQKRREFSTRAIRNESAHQIGSPFIQQLRHLRRIDRLLQDNFARTKVAALLRSRHCSRTDTTSAARTRGRRTSGTDRSSLHSKNRSDRSCRHRCSARNRIRSSTPA